MVNPRRLPVGPIGERPHTKQTFALPLEAVDLTAGPRARPGQIILVAYRDYGKAERRVGERVALV